MLRLCEPNQYGAHEIQTNGPDWSVDKIWNLEHLRCAFTSMDAYGESAESPRLGQTTQAIDGLMHFIWKSAHIHLSVVRTAPTYQQHNYDYFEALAGRSAASKWRAQI